MRNAFNPRPEALLGMWIVRLHRNRPLPQLHRQLEVAAKPRLIRLCKKREEWITARNALPQRSEIVCSLPSSFDATRVCCVMVPCHFCR